MQPPPSPPPFTLMDISPGHPPPQFNIDTLHNILYVLAFTGDAAPSLGDVVRFRPLQQASCLGAATADPYIYGGGVSADGRTIIQLPMPDITGMYNLCIASQSGGLRDSDFVSTSC